MMERPILFSGPMVRAIKERHKTQTRRVVRWPKWADPERDEAALRDAAGVAYYTDGVPRKVFCCPWGRQGDRLWVRETWKDNEPPNGWLYRATDELLVHRDERPWRPSIFMPRRASRLTLSITDVQVERLHDISDEDAKAEGCVLSPSTCVGASRTPYRVQFFQLWDAINLERGFGWDTNPLVWAISFEQVG